VNPEHERSLPRLLLWPIILVAFGFGVLYADKTPSWEAPDEPAQFNYVRHIAETGTLPVLNQGDYDQAYLERIKAAKFPRSMPISSIRYESYEPPLYYLFAAPVYVLAQATDLDPPLALRLFSVVLMVVLLLLADRVFVQVFPSSTTLQLAGVGFMATLPMHIAMSAAINADSLAEVLLALILLISVARAKGQLDDRRFVLFGGGVYGLALLTSIKIYPSALLLVLAELASRGVTTEDGGWKWEFREWRIDQWALRRLLALFGVSLLVSFWWFVRNALLYGGADALGLARHDAVVVGQPTTAQWLVENGLKNTVSDFAIITFRSFWAQFGWMGVLVNDRIYVSLLLLTGLSTLGLVLWLIRRPGKHDGRRDVSGRVWVLLSVWVLVTIVDYVAYNMHYFQPQGRYLFPALITIAALFVVGLAEIFDKRYTRIVFGIFYLGMVALDYISLFWFIIPQLSN
jgi:hypothetical protein